MTAHYREVQPVRQLMGRIPTDSDLFNALTDICLQENIQLGRIEAFGAVRKARIGYYDQHQREYRFQEIDRPMEITVMIGNMSVRNGEPALHAHITLADENGNAMGGHLAPGTIVFACEFVLQIFAGPAFTRQFDGTTGLPLWELKE